MCLVMPPPVPCGWATTLYIEVCRAVHEGAVLTTPTAREQERGAWRGGTRMVAEEINERVCTYGTRMYKGNPDIEVIWAPNLRRTSRIQLPVGNHRPLRLSTRRRTPRVIMPVEPDYSRVAGVHDPEAGDEDFVDTYPTSFLGSNDKKGRHLFSRSYMWRRRISYGVTGTIFLLAGLALSYHFGSSRGHVGKLSVGFGWALGYWVVRSFVFRGGGHFDRRKWAIIVEARRYWLFTPALFSQIISSSRMNGSIEGKNNNHQTAEPHMLGTVGQSKQA